VIVAIKTLQVRGAPLIGVTAAMALASHVDRFDGPEAELESYFMDACEKLAGSRPTAVNLFWAIGKVKSEFEKVRHLDLIQVKSHLFKVANQILDDDKNTCRLIGEAGAALLESGMKVLTHCNTGALATAGRGTALAVITTAAQQGKSLEVFVDETRPLLQGARLTTWELIKAGIPVTLICDSAAGVVLKDGIDCVIVGADRIAANGDTANKIGTYPLAVLAQKNKIPFFVAAPISTIDFKVQNGDQIPIETRAENEVLFFNGIGIAPKGVKVFNPAFDVTPADLIEAIITDRGVVSPPYMESLAKLRN